MLFLNAFSSLAIAAKFSFISDDLAGVPGEKVCGTVKSVAYVLPIKINMVDRVANIFVFLNFMLTLSSVSIERIINNQSIIDLSISNATK